jgi:hypothetical protein
MALAVAQTGHAGTTSSVPSQTKAFGSTTASGSLLVVLVDSRTTTVTSVTDSASNTYVQAGTTFTSYTNNNLSCWYAKNATANAGTVTVNYNAAISYNNIAIYEITGADTSGPLDTTKTGNGNSGTIASGSFTISGNEIIVAKFGNDNFATVTGNTGYTVNQYGVTGDANAYFGDMYHITSSSEAAGGTFSPSTFWGIFAASFKEASGGGGVTYPQLERFGHRGAFRGFLH